ncbi:MAG: cupin domain-containing protein [Terracidiphilus sp.]|jgi:quercetin dioxygenase-like cupin family protein
MKRIPIAFLILASAAGLVSAATISAQQSSSNPLAASRVFAYDEMAAKTASNGAVSRNAFTGTLATGEVIAAHETMQPAGTAPNPAHRIQHSELIVVEEGTLEYMHDGKTERATAGSIIYVALGTLHSVRNVGDGPARYVVIQIGGDTKK